MRKGQKASPETRAKMKAAHRRRWRLNRARYLVQCNYIHFGMKRSAATRKKMSEAHTGKKLTPAQVKAVKRYAHSAEGRIRKSRVAGGSAVMASDGRVWLTMADAARALCVDATSLRQALDNDRRSVKGLKVWRV